MTDINLNNEYKQVELVKYINLVLATIDYYLDNKLMEIKTADFDSDMHYKEIKQQTQEHFQKGRLTRLKQWFRDLTEMQVEITELKFNKYLLDKTTYVIDIFKSHNQQVNKVIEKGKILTDNQFYDIGIMVDQFCNAEPVDREKIDILKKLLGDYNERKSRQKRKPTA